MESTLALTIQEYVWSQWGGTKLNRKVTELLSDLDYWNSNLIFATSYRHSQQGRAIFYGICIEATWPLRLALSIQLENLPELALSGRVVDGWVAGTDVSEGNPRGWNRTYDPGRQILGSPCTEMINGKDIEITCLRLADAVPQIRGRTVVLRFTPFQLWRGVR